MKDNVKNQSMAFLVMEILNYLFIFFRRSFVLVSYFYFNTCKAGRSASSRPAWIQGKTIMFRYIAAYILQLSFVLTMFVCLFFCFLLVCSFFSLLVSLFVCLFVQVFILLLYALHSVQCTFAFPLRPKVTCSETTNSLCVLYNSWGKGSIIISVVFDHTMGGRGQPKPNPYCDWQIFS